jgi:VIT1/CCC1 family predicted Fe2+/Mn2+ transporter/rubrerythrin
MNPRVAPRPADHAESLANLRLEQDALALYDALSAIEKDPRRAETFRTIAGNERRHAGIWADRLRTLGAEVPPPARPRARVRFIILLARLFGTNAVHDLVIGLEGEEERIYASRPPSREAEAIAADERAHAEMWEQLRADASKAGTAPAAASGAAPATAVIGAASVAATDTAGTTGAGTAVITTPVPAAPSGAGMAAATSVDDVRRARVARTPDEIARAERWHRGGAGTLRAVVFGASDGLVSNLSLVMGIAGATADTKFILLSGIAGLLAGAASMAAGEYISVQSQREVLQRQIALERAELEAIPEEEKEELVAIYMAKGIPEKDARLIADKVFEDPETALETMVREELGLDPKQLGSPWSAAGGSFAAFCLGAIVPVIPYLFGGGTVVFMTSFIMSLAALFLVGSLVSLLTGRSLLFSGFRQVGLGAAAAAITYLVGHLIGVSVA